MSVHGHVTEKQYLILKSRLYERLMQFLSRFLIEVFFHGSGWHRLQIFILKKNLTLGEANPYDSSFRH